MEKVKLALRNLSLIHFLSKFLYLTRGHHRSLILMIFVFLIVACLEIFGTGIIGPFVAIATNPDSFEHNNQLSTIVKQLNFKSKQQFLIALGLLIVIAFWVKASLAFYAQKIVFEFSFNLRGELAHKLMKAYLNAPYSFHLRNNSATLIQDLSGSTNDFCLGLVMSLLTSVSNVLIILALMLLLLKTSSIALILIAMILLVVLGLFYPLKDRLARWGKEGWKANGEMIRIMNHGVGGLKETRILGVESYFDRQMEEETKKFSRNSSLAKSYGNLPRFVVEALMISFVIGFTLLSINLNSQSGQESLTAVLGIFALASIRLLPATGNLISGISNVRAEIHSLEQLFFTFRELEKEKILPDFASTKYSKINFSIGQDKEASSFTDQIVLDGINFSYPDTIKKVLNEISFIIPKGQSIGLIGKSGSGKTTLVDVFLGLFIPQYGNIKVDDVSIYGNLRAWQNLIGYVPQSIFLIDDTLGRNIAFGVPDHLVNHAKLRNAIEMAQLSEVVEQLPNGIQTVVGERGVLLSGGQRQRVGIARVIYHEREILVFDEATAALDIETERSLTEAIKALAGKKTIIIIAHRLSTIEHCDCIYQLEQGRIIKSGSYREVVLGQ